METIKKYKYLFLSIIGNCMILYGVYLTYGKIKFSFIYLIFGFLPLVWQVTKLKKDEKQSR